MAKKITNHHNIDELIKTQFNDFKPAERKIANHLLSNYPMAGMVSITELSNACDVSAPTVMRTLKRIGFTSFIDFQKSLKAELSKTLSDPVAKHGQWATGTPKEHILNQAAESVVSNLRNTMKQISFDTFNQVVDLLADDTKSLHLVGGRITHAFSSYLGTHLEVIRKAVFKLPPSVSLWPHHLLNIEKGDVVVVFDVRRYEADLLSLVELAQKKGAVIVLFSDQWLSPIANLADYTFPIRIEAPSGWDSGVATLFVIEALITAVESKLWPDASKRIQELEDAFDFTGRFKQEVK
ncbi:MAG: MurR/RpiR family transcriptional regulator [Gammaproteobacteria bacterium]|jgi:DNA-binding MurR/RpiR family transcriptional regulator|nr:MurR/RpiR family transcriptional regulator [Gammaproteobacteria bacterium]MBT3723203.1 MurR/RpiR family transcriptional regulator [Gammaproteobacteria bacterium]MBT4077440.1 MurR/RpiR family transcriptional regulator [Gammaproteobacteria bacterium]MBT4193734.1 MurR/RpiR family transcriptional regulator [Gammaproteobacteria bacterium]MBT4450137.1 MurR/RpiR family transcriptional regulator [Gammaproteobacteria bacterium]